MSHASRMMDELRTQIGMCQAHMTNEDFVILMVEVKTYAQMKIDEVDEAQMEQGGGDTDDGKENEGRHPARHS